MRYSKGWLLVFSSINCLVFMTSNGIGLTIKTVDSSGADYTTIQDAIDDAINRSGQDRIIVHRDTSGYDPFVIAGDQSGIEIVCVNYPDSSTMEYVRVDGATGDHTIRIRNCYNIGIFGLNLHGVSSSKHGVKLQDVSNVTLADIYIKDHDYSGIRLSHGAKARIVDCEIDENANHGIIIKGYYGACDVDIEFTDIVDNGEYGIYVEDNDDDTGPNDVHIKHTRVRNSGVVLDPHHGIYIDTNSADVSLEYVTASSNSKRGIKTDSDDIINIENCNLIDNDSGDTRDASDNGAYWDNNYYSDGDHTGTYTISGPAGAVDLNEAESQNDCYWTWDDDPGNSGDHPPVNPNR